MHTYLVKFHREYTEGLGEAAAREPFSPDRGERVGQWGLGWLSLGFGKSIRVTQIDTKSSLQLSFEKETLPLWQRVGAIVSALLLFPISLLLAGIGCIGLACSESHDKMQVNYKAVKAAKTKYVPTQEEIEIEERGKESAKAVKVQAGVKVKSANLQADIFLPAYPVKSSTVENVTKPIPSHCDIRGEVWLDSHANIDRYAEYLQPFYPNIHFLGSGEFEDMKPQFLGTWDVLKKKNTLPEAFTFSLNILDSHWTHVYICRKKRTIEYYDPKVDYGGQKTLRKTLNGLGELADKLNREDPGKPYEVIQKIKKRLQTDGYQCGIWALYFMEERAKNPDVDFNALDIKEAQKMIARHRLYVMDKLIEWHKISPFKKNGKIVD